jgi:hypothetical protein
MQLAIIGAGAAGLTAGYHLATTSIADIARGANSPPYDITLFEKSRGLAGRAATRWYDRPAGRVYVDHGAQFMKAEGGVLHDLMFKTLPRESLVEIPPPVWTFTAQNHIAPGGDAQNAIPRLTYAQGLATLGRLLQAQANLQVKTQVRVGRLHLNGADYTLIDAEGRDLGGFKQVIVAIPAGQAADLIQASETLPTASRSSLVGALRQATYRRCLSVILGFDRPLTPRPYCALLNIDRQHPIAWIGLEHTKPGHVPHGNGVLVVQMSGEYSLAHWDTDKDAVIRDAAALASEVLGEDVSTADWADLQKWRYSQPETLIESQAVNGQVPGLWFAGDYLRGGRVHLAAQSGLDVFHLLRHTTHETLR